VPDPGDRLRLTFIPLAVDGCAERLARHGVEGERDAPTTLAALNAVAEGLDPGDELQLADFGA
jgi:hypothetical protein